MKTILKYFSCVAMIIAAGLLVSCTSEAPFQNDGEGLVHMNVMVSSNVTRAESSNDDLQKLADGCNIYVSRIRASEDKSDVLHKWVGIDKIPQNGITLKYGSYVAEAFAGDSVGASFDKKYFKGIEFFSVTPDVPTQQISLVCKIANVVTSVDQIAEKDGELTDLVVTFSHTRASLTFEGESLDDKGYFMMPNGETALNYIITGKNKQGEPFEYKNMLKSVKPGHEYRLVIKASPTAGSDGGVLVDIVVEETDLTILEDVEIFGRPAFSWVGMGIGIDEQLVNLDNQFETRTLRVGAYNGFKTLKMSTENPTLISILEGNSQIMLLNISETAEAMLAGIGIKVTDMDPVNNLYKYFIEFNADFLNSLPKSQEEYVIHISVEDMRGKTNEMDVRIANTEQAIVYLSPIRIDLTGLDDTKNPMAVLSTSATIPVIFTQDNVENPGLQYRELGSQSWQTKSVTRTSGGTVVLTGLKAATTYECRGVAGKIENGEYEFASDIATFTTETVFSIPNSSFEEWGTYSASTMLGTKTVTFPGSDRSNHYWDSGNEGAATANKVLTDKSTDMVHSGTYSARLASDAAMGIIAAGNIFTGYYVKTDGTNGVLSVGRPYDGSHPTKLRVYANYRPGDGVTIKSGNEEFVEIVKGGTDHGQIYVALTTAPVEIRTNPDNRKLFNKDDNEVLAYGQITWKEPFGPDGALQQVDIPLEYNNRAKTMKPTHLVIVCSASKFGDYFCGSKTSVMYLDDFELVYE